MVELVSGPVRACLVAVFRVAEFRVAELRLQSGFPLSAEFGARRLGARLQNRPMTCRSR